MKIYVLLHSFYEGDSNLVEELVMLGQDKDKLVDNFKEYTKRLNCQSIIYDTTIGEKRPNDGSYSQKANRYVIRELNEYEVNEAEY